MNFAKSALENRFGLRILIIFTASAIVPMLILAVLAYTSTRDQLEEDALISLQRDVKSATMSIAEQINIGAAQLDLVATTLGDGHSSRLNAFSRIDESSFGGLDLTPREQEHLRANHFLLLMSGHRDEGIRLLKMVDSRILIGFFESDFLYKPERLAEGERYWVTNQAGRYLFGISADESTRELVATIDSVETRLAFELESRGGPELALVWPLFLKHPYLSPELHVGISRRLESIHRPLQDFRFNFIIALLLGFLGSTAVALYQIRVRVRPLEEIMRATHEIEQGVFSYRAEISSGDEFELLGSSINAMAEKLGDDFESLETLRSVSDSLLDAQDFQNVAEQVVPAAILFTGARVGTLFVVDRSSPSSARTLIEIRGETGSEIRSSIGNQDRFSFAMDAFEQGEMISAGRPDGIGERPRSCRTLDRVVGSRVEAVVAIPLTARSGESEGVLQLAFCDEIDRDPVRLTENRSLSILAGQAGAAIRNIAWMADLRGLFEGVIRLTINAIDEKSAYTGDHCRRVPVLAEIIADAICENDEGPLKDFVLSDKERYELKIAALLHDCGKVATPVHVMDKATKLETIHDRIDLIQARAEIVRRDLEVASLRMRLESESSKSISHGEEAESLRRLEEDLAFVQRCNVGGESMDEQHRERVDEIASRYRWVDQSGLERGMITDDESMNLKIGRGTLNEAEREVINQHVVTTIKLLEELPFPEELQNVPAIAGAHHERVDGTGYPLGLGADQLSIQARILGLADVFEALTAKTRPYKPGKSLTETLEILGKMVEGGQLDRDLHEVFVRKKVYLKYAAEYVAGDQIDRAHQMDLERMTAAWESDALV